MSRLQSVVIRHLKMSCPCSECDRPLGDDLALRCANPRCSSVVHSACAGGSVMVDDGGRVPRWRCRDCRVASAPSVASSASGYKPVFERPQLGSWRPKVAEAINTPIDTKVRLALIRDKFGPVRGSTGTLIDTPRPEPNRPRSAILTPTDENLSISNPLNSTSKKPSNSASQNPSNSTLQKPSNLSIQPPSASDPVRTVTPDEKYEESVKSFYKWLQDHECSRDKPKPSGLVRDKIAMFGAKLENHLATRCDKTTQPNTLKSGAVEMTHPTESPVALPGTKKPFKTDEIHDEILVVRDQMPVQNPPSHIRLPEPQIKMEKPQVLVQSGQPKLISALKMDSSYTEPMRDQFRRVKFEETPKFSPDRPNEHLVENQSDDDDDFPPPPPPLETNLDEIVDPNSGYSTDEPVVVGKRVMASPKQLSDPIVAVGEQKSGELDANSADPTVAYSSNVSSSVGHNVQQDARIVQHNTLSSRGQFTATVRPENRVQVSEN